MFKNWPGISHKLVAVDCGPSDRYFKNQIGTIFLRPSIVSIFYPDTVFKVYIHTTTYIDWPRYLSSLLCVFISLSFFVSRTFINPHFKFFNKKLYKIIHVWCLTEYQSINVFYKHRNRKSGWSKKISRLTLDKVGRCFFSFRSFLFFSRLFFISLISRNI